MASTALIANGRTLMSDPCRPMSPNMASICAPLGASGASAIRSPTRIGESLDSEVDPASIPLPDPIDLQSLPTELLDHIGAYIREREWGPYPCNRTKSERKTAQLIWPLKSPRNKNQLNFRWSCGHTLHHYQPRLRVRIDSFERLHEWAQGPKDLASYVRYLVLDFRACSPPDLQRRSYSRPPLIHLTTIQIFMSLARCLLLMPALEEISIRGLPGNAECRSSPDFDSSTVAALERLVESIKLDRLRRLEIAYEERRPGREHHLRRWFNARCCGSCRQLESIFVSSVARFQVIRLDLPTDTQEDVLATARVRALIPPIRPDLGVLWIKLPVRFDRLLNPGLKVLPFPTPEGGLRELRFLPTSQSCKLLVYRGGQLPRCPSVQETLQRTPFLDTIFDWLDLFSSAEELDLLLAVVRCRGLCPTQPYNYVLCRSHDSGFGGDYPDCGIKRVDQRVLDRVSEMKADEHQEEMERGVVLEFAQELPRLRKLWTWRECDRDELHFGYSDRHQEADKWMCNTICRVAWTIEHTPSGIQATSSPDYEVYKKYVTRYADYGGPNSKLLWCRTQDETDEPYEESDQVRRVGIA